MISSFGSPDFGPSDFGAPNPGFPEPRQSGPPGPGVAREAPASHKADPGYCPLPAEPDPVETLPDGPLVIGTPIYNFEPRPVRRAGHEVFRPDMAVEGWATNGFLVRCASLRGYSHRWDGTSRQDDFAVAVHSETGVLLAAVADGVSAAPLSHIGAAWACSTAMSWLNGQLDAGMAVDELPWGDLLTTAALALVDYAATNIAGAAESADEAGRLLATTLVVAVAVPHGDGTATAHLIGAGDSGAWLLREGVFSPLLGDKLGGAGEIAETSVSFPLPSLSPVAPRPSRVFLSPLDVLLIGSDGFGDPLGSGSGEVGRIFSRHLARPPAPLAFAHLLDFSRETYDDDRSLVAIWPQSLK